jgi:hypothetical protein
LKSLVIEEVRELLQQLLIDIRLHHPHLAKTLNRDAKTLEERLASEGLGFATVALPTLAKSLYAGLETGKFETPKGFKRLKGTVLPRFLGGLLTQVFDGDGLLKKDPDETAVTDIVQVSAFCYKLDLPYSPKKESAVIDAFIATEVDLEQLDLSQADQMVLEDAADLVVDILKGFDPMDITPRHGPGAVATGEKNTEKWAFKRRYKRINWVYPYNSYFVPSRMSLARNFSKFRRLERYDDGCARVVLVPKDSRGPRLISMEPLEFQFIQQGLSRALVGHLERRSCITSGFVNFTDQTINRSLALHNSCTRRYATLDLKEASDRVSLELVRRLFRKRPDILACLEATRTSRTELPDGRIIPMLKFAPMGSALCFPVEALVFFVLAEIARRQARIAGRVYVYGDDLIVPTELAPTLFELFPTMGLKFNSGKCFTRGYFRESCGLDAYRGNVCTPVRMRKCLPSSRRDATGLVSAVALSNYLWERGYWRTADYVRGRVNRFLRIDVLRSPRETFGGLSYTSFTSKGVIIGSSTRCRFNKGADNARHSSAGTVSQGFEVFAYQAKFRARKSRYTEFGRMFANLLNQRQDQIVDPHATQIQMRWIPFYS